MVQALWTKISTKKNWALLLGLIFLISFYFVTIFGHLENLPGPIYGGDLYYQHGHIMHLYEGGSIFANSHYADGFEPYAWLTHLSVATLSKIAHVSPLQANLFFPLIVIILKTLIAFSLGKKIFKNKNFALLLAFMWMVPIPDTHPSSVTEHLMVPLFVLALYYFNYNLKSILLAGAVIGVAGLTHPVAFFGALTFFALKVLFDWKGHNVWQPKKIISVLTTLILGSSIALLYWWPLISMYGGATLNSWQEYTGQGLFTFGFFFKSISTNFINILDPVSTTASVLGIAGIFAATKTKLDSRLPLLIFLTACVGILHPIITEPLFHTSLGYYRFPIIFTFLRTLLISYGIYFFYKKFDKDKPIKKAITILTIIFILATILQQMHGYIVNPVRESGFKMDERMESVLSMAETVKKNTNVDDVFLSNHGESSFAINALTGRKVIHMRRTHASPFVDVDERIVDAAIILYGNSETKRDELLQKYDTNFYYADFYSAMFSQECNASWQKLDSQIKIYSCLLVNPKYLAYLKKFGISTNLVHATLDPASPNAPIFDMLAIRPTELKINTETISEIFDAQNNFLAGIYKISSKL